MLKDMDLKCKKQLFDIVLDSCKTTSKNVVHKTAEFLGNKTPDVVTKSKDDKIVNTKGVIAENSRNVEEIIIPQEKREGISNELRQILKKWNSIKYLSY